MPLENTALLAVDVHAHFCSAAYGHIEAEKAARRLATVKLVFNELQIPVFVIKVPNHEDWYEHGGRLHIICETAGDTTITKSKDHDSAFIGTDLDEQLQQRDIAKLIVGGFNTGFCVTENVVHACERGYDVSVLSDGIGSMEHHTELLNQHGIRRMRKAGARFIHTWQILEGLLDYDHAT